ncbi:hypothetical protein HL658_09820 [Azospirillum sp. RWY-5-1]|nr:hypothetical protein [Azospirillum oleiclasticum]
MWQGIGLIIVAVFLVRACGGGAEPPPVPSIVPELDAASMCHDAIQQRAPGFNVRMGHSFHTDQVFHFTYIPADAQLAPTTQTVAACVVSRVNKRISYLSIRGETFIHS